jgi:hypothetical protein
MGRVPKLTLRGRLWAAWHILTTPNPGRYSGDGRRYGRVVYYHIVPMKLVIRISEKYL